MCYMIYNLSAIGVLSKDFSIMVGYVLRVIFFLTPVFWKTDMISKDLDLVYLINPYYHFLELFRNPLLGESVRLINYQYCFIFFILNLIIYKFFLKKITIKHALYI